MSKDIQFIDIGGVSCRVCLDWKDAPLGVDSRRKLIKILKTENKTNKKERTKVLPIKHAIINITESGIQYAPLDTKNKEGKTQKKAIIPALSIIAKVKSLYTPESHWVYYHQLNDDNIWFIICDKNGYITGDSDKIVGVSDFFDILDEYILVSDSKNQMKIFSENFDIFDDFDDIVELEIFELGDNFKSGYTLDYIGDKTVFGVPPILILLMIMALTIYGINELLKFSFPPPKAFHAAGLKNPKKQIIDRAWGDLEMIMADTNNGKNIHKEFEILHNALPINIQGWDYSGIVLSNKEYVITYNSTLFQTTEVGTIKRIVINSIRNASKEVSSIKFIPGPQRVNLHFVVRFKGEESILRFESLDEYQRKSGFFDYKKNIDSLKGLKRNYNGTMSRITNTIAQYQAKPVYELAIEGINGALAAAKFSIEANKLTLAEDRRKYNEALKGIQEEIKVTPEAIAEKIFTLKGLEDVFARTKNNPNFIFVRNIGNFKDGLNVSRFSMNGLGLKEMLFIIKKNEDLPMRYQNVEYDWLGSRWKIDGVIYERN